MGWGLQAKNEETISKHKNNTPRTKTVAKIFKCWAPGVGFRGLFQGVVGGVSSNTYGILQWRWEEDDGQRDLEEMDEDRERCPILFELSFLLLSRSIYYSNYNTASHSPHPFRLALSLSIHLATTCPPALSFSLSPPLSLPLSLSLSLAGRPFSRTPPWCG